MLHQKKEKKEKRRETKKMVWFWFLLGRGHKEFPKGISAPLAQPSAVGKWWGREGDTSN